MIGLPRVPDPCSLLWTEELGRRATTLQDECLQIMKGGLHRPIESLCQDAQNLHDQGDRGGCAVILIYLSDLCRARGKLGPALKFSKEAKQIFSSRPENRYTHNSAVALYSLGLVHQLLGLDEEAEHYYNEAWDAFLEAKEQWLNLRDNDRVQRCDEIVPLIEQLMTYVARARVRRGTSAIRCPVLVGCWPPDTNPPDVDQLLVDVKVEKIVVDMRLRLGNNSYKLESLERNGLAETAIQPSEEYYVLKVPEQLPSAIPQFRDARYVLVHEDMREDEWGFCTEIDDDQIRWGKFTRDRNGDMQFEATYPETDPPTPRIIGGDDLDQRTTGSIVGIFEAA